jgi:hypothetical protein
LFSINTPNPVFAERVAFSAAQTADTSVFASTGLLSQSAGLAPPQPIDTTPIIAINADFPNEIIPTIFENTTFGPHNPCSVDWCPFCGGDNVPSTNCREWAQTDEGLAFRIHGYLSSPRRNASRSSMSGSVAIHRCIITDEFIVYRDGVRLTREETQAFMATSGISAPLSPDVRAEWLEVLEELRRYQATRN